MAGTPKDQSEPGLTDDEIAKRRDEVIRRMLNTPPPPKQNKEKPHGKTKQTPSN